MYAYYSFYCYTDGMIAGFADYFRFSTDEPNAQPDWDPVAHKWKDWSNPADVKRVKILTKPCICSSFIWQAVQEVIKAGPSKIILDWADNLADALGEAGGKCKRRLPPDSAADVTDSVTLDGLFFYYSETRKQAAIWLQESISSEVYKSLKENLKKQGGLMEIIAGAIDNVGRGAFIAAAKEGTDAVFALLSAVVSPIVAAALTAALLEELIELLYDMPEDIGNQICNSFAFNCHRGFPGDIYCIDADGNKITDVDSQNWADAPGPGRCVSPDNIYMFWDAPASRHDDQGSGLEVVRGLYGYNAPVQLVVAVLRRPICELVKSTGTATIKGFVLLHGKPVSGAYVKAACQHTVSEGAERGYRLSVRSGARYKLIARYEEKGRVFYGERATSGIAAGSVVTKDIHLNEPPVFLRKIIVRGKIRVDDVYLTYADHGDNDFTKDLYVQYGVPIFGCGEDGSRSTALINSIGGQSV